MSQIAHALAKAKERTGQTAVPFLSTGGAPAPVDAARAAASAAALKRAKARQRFWLILALVALPLTGFILWTQFREEVVPEPAASSAPIAEAAPAQAASSPFPASATSPVAAAPAPSATASGTAASAANTPAPRPELAQVVGALAISAVMPGDPARIMLAGKVVRAGDTVSAGLVFSGYANGQLRFTDTRGAVYTRYY